MAQWLGTHTDLTEELSVISRVHINWLTLMVTIAPRGSDAHVDPCIPLHIAAEAQIYTDTHHLK